jgi:hypothetical protein
VKVSLINVNLVAEDAIGSCIIHQVRLFQRQGHDAQVYVLDPPHNVPADVESATRVVSLGDLVGGRQEHFCLSDLYIFHYPGRYELLETIRGIDRGRVIFYYHNVTPPVGQRPVRCSCAVEGKALAHYADLCITDSPSTNRIWWNVGFDADRIPSCPWLFLWRVHPATKTGPVELPLEGQRVPVFAGWGGNKRIDLLISFVHASAWCRTRCCWLATIKTPAFRDCRRPSEPALGNCRRCRAGRVEIHHGTAWPMSMSRQLHEGFGSSSQAMACGSVGHRAGNALGGEALLLEPEMP